jgi:L-asparaginase
MVQKLVFLGMGGTIAGQAASAGDNVGYKAGQVGIRHLLDAVPGLAAALGSAEAESEQVCQIDSKDLDHADWFALVSRIAHHLERIDVAGVVVTHGTDTLEETAFWLSRTLPSELLAGKLVVLTCAMRPASSLAPDGPVNIADAVTVALSEGARGVVVVCAGKIHSALHVQKVHPYRVDAFDSGEAGPLGLVEEGRVRMLACWPQLATSPVQRDLEVLRAKGLPRVELVVSHSGAGGAIVRSLMQAVGGDAPLRGLVVAGTGNGTIHKDLQFALETAQASGIRVVRVSRCGYGQVVGPAAPSASTVIESCPLSAVKARIALMLEIAEAP